MAQHDVAINRSVSAVVATRPTLARLRRLTDKELARFEKQVRPLADAGRGILRSAFAYLRAIKT
jgi:hypothetical protein